jgi:hypothetical protein
MADKDLLAFTIPALTRQKATSKAEGSCGCLSMVAGEDRVSRLCGRPDFFTVEQGAHEMGRIVAFETDRPGWAIVGFKSHESLSASGILRNSRPNRLPSAHRTLATST